ncbi:hypothetical protein DYB32_000251 [Aphanomyces invadans]|uniref:Wings apart-like protein C-terminal domain-containing protein n=1 Tax=Aphanomyces invadans TaxID=157072 RepID=A0A3R6VUA9_9STRA|nr:hypothetical protein DYB32_000251 [Aphanomyces invadans]
MQSTASLQHSGESHAALEQIHYYLDGIEEGQGPSRSMSALQLAEVCALKSPGPPHLASPIPTMSTNGRLLLRAKGGLAQCMDLVERLKVEHAAHAYEHIYCMMTLLYFVTLDSENCKSLTSDVLSKVLQVLELTSDTPWKYNHATVVVVTRDGDASNKRALLRKKSSTRRLGDAKRGVSLVAQAETLLRSDDMFRSTDVMPIVTLTDVVLGVLNNAFHTDQKNEYGNSNNKTIHSTPCASKSLATAALLHDRKMLLRDCGGLDTIARIIDVASAASVVERGAASHLFHSMRLLEQASFLERGIQDHLVLHTNVLSVLLRILSSSRHDTRELTLMALRVLINLTHKNDIASTHIAAAHGTHALLALFLHASSSTSSQETEEPSMLDNDKAGFDMCLLALGALINCVEHNETNRDDVARYNDSILDMLTAYFVTRVSTFEHILLRPNADVIATWHPEDVILSGSMAMLLGCIMRKRSSNAHRILAALPDQSPHLLLRVLVAFVGLHAQIGALSEEILESCIDVETELKALMDHGEGQTENTPSLTLTFKADDIRKSMANFGIPVALTKKNPSPQEGYNSQLSIDAPVEFTTPKYPSTFRGGNTPPASAFHFSGGFSNVSTPDSAESSARRTTPKVALRKRTSRTLGVYTPQDSVDSKRAKGAAFIWADETASDDGTNGSSAAILPKM